MPRGAKPVETPKPKATQIEREQMFAALEDLMLMGHRRAFIFDKMGKQFGVGESRVEEMMTEVYRRWKAEPKVDATEKRDQQERRLLTYLTSCKNVTERCRVEAIYAKIAGTEAPTRLAGAEGDEPIKFKFIVEDYRKPEPKA